MVNPKKSSKSAKVKSEVPNGLRDKHSSLTGEKKRVEKLLMAPSVTRRPTPVPAPIPEVPEVAAQVVAHDVAGVAANPAGAAVN